MRYQGLCEGTYAGKSLTPAGDRCKNFYPETLNGAGSPEAQKVLQGTPGTTLFATAASPIQQIYYEPSDPTLLVIANNSLYQYTGIFSLIGVVGVGPYTMNSNGRQVMISCAGDNTGYIFTYLTGVLTKIVAAAFMGSVSNVAIDNYFISTPLQPTGGANDRKFQISGLSDGLSWGALDFALASGGAEAIVGLHSDHGELWVFGSRHAEIYQDTGNASFPFERIKSIYISHGLAARKAVVSLDNAVFWLGRNEHGQCRVFRSDGYIPKGVSNRSVEYFFNLYAQNGGVADATMHGYQNESGHTFLVISFPSATVDISLAGSVTTSAINGAQWVYDITENEWHERSKTWGDGKEGVPPMVYHAFVEGVGHVVGGGDGGANTYLMKEDAYTYNGTAIKRVRRAPHITNAMKWINYAFLRLSAQVGVIPAATEDKISLRVSNDGGMTWSSVYQKSLGFTGDYKREICWRRLGRAKRRAFELSTIVNAPVCIIDADLGVDGEA